MYRLGLAIGLAAAVAGAAGASSPDPKDLAVPYPELEKARVLVRALGSEAFRDRERAERELAGMGRLARPVLAEAAGTDPNPEVRVRATRLLPRAEAADLQARVDTFLADADGKYDHDLPGLALFRKHVGTDRAARELFAEVVKGRPNLDLLAAVGASAEDGGRAIADRRVGLFLAQHPQSFNRFAPPGAARPQFPTVPDVAALLVAETAVPAADIPRPGPFQYLTAASFLSTPAAAAAIANPDTAAHGAAFRTALARWLDTRTAPTDLDNLGQAQVAQLLRQVPEMTALLRRTVTTPGVQGWARGQAVGFLVQRGGAAERPFLKSLLKDETPVATVWLGNNPQGVVVQASCQLRDLALGVLLMLDKQDLKEFGYSVPQGTMANLQNVQNGGGANFGFTTDEKRAAAHRLWADHEAGRLAPLPRPVLRK
ncbi:MAG: hypothetical protein K2X87_33705 [Gemmataceae bacterium]|nr:hypothetical protein [Gemmataceae bacterium]